MLSGAKALIWITLGICAVNLVIGCTVFGVTMYGIYSKKRHISVPVMKRWEQLLNRQMFLIGSVIIGSIITIWSVTKARRKIKALAFGIILAHFILLIASAYFTTEFCDLVNQAPLEAQQVFEYTKVEIQTEIRRGQVGKTWLPIWLDTIQLASNSCCGIRTFRDWNELWAPVRDVVPKSCCLPDLKDSCHFDLKTILYPSTGADNIKVEEGCHREILGQMNLFLKETYKFSLLLTITLTLGLIALVALHLFIFIFNRKVKKPKPETLEPLFLTEEQTWKTLNFFPTKTNAGGGSPNDLDDNLNNMTFDQGLDPGPGGSSESNTGPVPVSSSFDDYNTTSGGGSGRGGSQPPPLSGGVRYEVNLLPPQTVTRLNGLDRDQYFIQVNPGGGAGRQQQQQGSSGPGGQGQGQGFLDRNDFLYGSPPISDDRIGPPGQTQQQPQPPPPPGPGGSQQQQQPQASPDLLLQGPMDGADEDQGQTPIQVMGYLKRTHRHHHHHHHRNKSS